MRDHLAARGVDVELLDSRWFPAALQLRYDPAEGQGSLRLPTGRVIDWVAVRSVYWRVYNNVQAPPLPDQEQAYIASNDARGLFESLLIRLPARWVNGWNGFRLH